MNKKGFTLIEILAVIVVLGLLGAIIIPKVVNTIDSSKKNSDRVSAELLVRALTNIAIDKKANLVSFDGCSIDFDNDSNTCIDLEYSGKLPTSGSISVDSDGNVSGSVGFGENIYQIAYNEICYYVCVGFEYAFDYSGSQQELKIYNSGFYKLEVWGAQGGNAISSVGGYGAYSVGIIYLNQSQKLFVYVGGKGENSKEYSTVSLGGYNGGGDGKSNYDLYFAGGGGATHIALESGVLSSLSSDIDKILIVAGGGGGAGIRNSSSPAHSGGSGGGEIGNAGYSQNDNNLGAGGGGSQYSGGTSTSLFTNSTDGNGGVVMSGGFGFGGSGNLNTAYPKSLDSRYSGGSGGGGGYYGGASGYDEASGAGGGSGYIGNSSLLDKHMTCFECHESADVNIKTVSTMNISEEPINDMAKIGNGFAKITYLGKSID